MHYGSRLMTVYSKPSLSSKQITWLCKLAIITTIALIPLAGCSDANYSIQIDSAIANLTSEISYEEQKQAESPHPAQNYKIDQYTDAKSKLEELRKRDDVEIFPVAAIVSNINPNIIDDRMICNLTIKAFDPRAKVRGIILSDHGRLLGEVKYSDDHTKGMKEAIAQSPLVVFGWSVSLPQIGATDQAESIDSSKPVVNEPIPTRRDALRSGRVTLSLKLEGGATTDSIPVFFAEE